MPLIKHNLEPLYRGDSREYNLTFTDNAGAVIDISTWKIYFTAKIKYKDSDDLAVIKKDITIHSEPENGKTKIILTPTDTDIDPGSYYYDIQVKRAAESILTVLMGKIKIITDITRRTD